MGKEQIDIFEETIKEQLLGPGSDVLADKDPACEVISDTPLRRYFTGILFPVKITETQGDFDSDQFEANDENSEVINDDKNINDHPEEQTPDEIQEVLSKEFKNTDEEDKANLLSNHFYPSDMGITFCVNSKMEKINVEFSFATYNIADQTSVFVKSTRSLYKALIDEKSGFPFKSNLKYEGTDENNGILSINKTLNGTKKGQKTGDYAALQDWRTITRAEENSAQLMTACYKFEEIVTRIHWQRKPALISKSILLINQLTPKLFEENENVAYTVTVKKEKDRKYIKIQLVNKFPGILHSEYSNQKELLNKSCLFQAEIKVDNDNFQSLKPYSENKFSKIDEELEEINFLYRSLDHFSIGHNCSSIWSPIKKPTQIKSSFIPTYNLNETKTTIDDLIEIPLFDISLWGMPKNEVIAALNKFVNKYRDWIQLEQKKSKDSQKPIGKKIISSLDEVLFRLNEGVELLKSDDNLFRAFQFANTSMLLQFCLNDEDFYETIQNANLIEEGPFFNDSQKKFTYRPFQLAFLLISIESTINPKSKYRADAVDLIWFPTGGGKTEAYLAVAALTIVLRRMNCHHYEGVSVIMRYTLRLLAAQQFERASKIITVLDYLRKQFISELKDEPISIGLWIGDNSTPNKLKKAIKVEENIRNNGESANQFQLDTCPWCNSNLIQEQNGKTIHAFRIQEKKKNLKIKCLNDDCNYSQKGGLPIQIVDECLYSNPPTLLFGTVDKFAMLSWEEGGHKFFNSLNKEGAPPPDLIIQDELHLLTGPLGSIVGLFESVIESLCTSKGVGPKIVASTATTRNTTDQVKQLYGNRKVNIFPPPGLNFNDSFFAKQAETSNRRYLGIMPTGNTGVSTQIKLLTVLAIARLKVFSNDKDSIDPYWTLVSYYNSLKDVGRMSNKVGDELQQSIQNEQSRLKFESTLQFNYRKLKTRSRELTSRIDSSKIKKTLGQLEKSFALEEFKGYFYPSKDLVDLVLATNMLSVGIDIARLNVMQINGMPRNTSEYIQASSRVGRKDKGLVIPLFDSNRARDKSHFENFLNFHQSLYKQIEPLSITPFTENTIEKMISSLFISYMRHKKGYFRNTDILKFKREDTDQFKEMLKNRYRNNPNIKIALNKIDDLSSDWLEKINQEDPYIQYSGEKNALLTRPGLKTALKDTKWVVMQSMRDIDSSSFIRINPKFERRS